MTDYDKLEEQRQMARSNYYAQLAMMGYDSGGNPLDMVHVVHCRDCRYCEPLKTTPGFFCKRLERNLYAPHYEDSSWYCADGERRDDDAAD